MEKDQPKVFLSYPSSIGDFAELVMMKLENGGIEVWKDTHQIQAGEEWRNEIDTGLLQVDAIIVLLNSATVSSSYVTYEWAFALGSGKAVIPVLLEDCDIHPRMRVLQYLDFRADNRPWDKLIQRIKELNVARSVNKVKVGDLTVDEFRKILEGGRSLTRAKAKNTGVKTSSADLTEAMNQIITARTYLETIRDKSGKVLWVDDKPQNNVNERDAIKALGFKIDVATTTEDAVRLLARDQYAAIISDMGREEGESAGYDLLKRIRSRDKKTPFFIYGSSGQLVHKVMAQERGAQGSTNNPTELIDLVTTHVGPITI